MADSAATHRDPPVRADGKCVVCGGERVPPKGRRDNARHDKRIVARKPAVDVAAMVAGDPFCSTDCCKKYHGVVTNSGSGTPIGRPRVGGMGV